MAVAEAVRKSLLPTGLAVALVGLLLAVWAVTGSRRFDAAYFFVALAGVTLVVVGIATAAFGRAMAPRGKAAKKSSPPATRPPPPAAAKKEPSAEPNPLTSPEPVDANAPPAPAAAPLLQCPECAHVFPLPSGDGAVVCPGCKAEGERPDAAAG